jgi:histone deacetylase complex regulatory component SIN3
MKTRFQRRSAPGAQPATQAQPVPLPQVAAQRPKTRPKRGRAALDDAAQPPKRPQRGRSGRFVKRRELDKPMDDAVRYILLVKELLHPKDYQNFLEMLKEFKAQKLGYAGVVQRVSALFQGHPRRPELARGFNIFLPRGYKFRVELSSPGEVVTIDDSDDDDDGFEMLETRTAEERIDAARAHAEQQGDVVSLE